MGLIITLMIIGLILILSEIFLVPGIGVAGILGILSISGSSYLVFSGFGTMAGIIVTAVNVAILVCMTVIAFRANTWKRLSLNTNIESKAVADETAMVCVGDKGKAMTRLAPTGAVRFDAGKVEARAFEGMIDAGSDVEVVLIEDDKIYVKQI